MAPSEIRRLSHPFYRVLERRLQAGGFDAFAEEACREFYAPRRGRPSIPPGVYFRMLLVGYLEGVGSERGIVWRCADSISLREFLGYGLSNNPPDHSRVSRTRRRLSLEAHEAVFAWVLKRLRSEGLLSGKTLGVDSTTLEASAALRSIVRRDDGSGYEEWLEELVRSAAATRARGEARAGVCPPASNRRAAPGAGARAREHPQTIAGSRRGLQPGAAHAPSSWGWYASQPARAGCRGLSVPVSRPAAPGTPPIVDFRTLAAGETNFAPKRRACEPEPRYQRYRLTTYFCHGLLALPTDTSLYPRRDNILLGNQLRGVEVV